MSWRILGGRMAFGFATAVFVAGQAQTVDALSLEESILLVLETNPEIKAAEANKQAIEFELDQARSFFAPRIELESRAEGSINDGTRSSDLTSADDGIFGYEIVGRVTQNIYNGNATRSQIDRQAYRVDAAAFRVLERAEFLSLETARVYSDVLRTRKLTALARNNLDYHQRVLAQIQGGFDTGILGIGDLQQAEERLFLAEDTLLQFQLNETDTELSFLETVGVVAEGLGSVPSVARLLPASVEQTLATAWQNNPTIKFFQSDVGAAEALSREAQANRFPTLDLEAVTRYGEDLRGFEGDVRDAAIGLVLRYEIQGNRKRGQREEQIRRVGEQRARLLNQSRLVEREVRQSWADYQSAQRRASILSRQAALSRELLQSYEQEFDVGTRSLLDVLNTQNAAFQAETNLVNAQSLEVFLTYRLLAAAGILLPSLNITPPEDSVGYSVQQQGSPELGSADPVSRGDARSFSDWRRGVSTD